MKLEGPYPAQSTFLARGGNPVGAETKLLQLREWLLSWNADSVRPPILTMNHIGLINAGLHPAFCGLVLGFSTPAQVLETLDFWRDLDTYDYTYVWKRLTNLIG
ncbi:MAG: hypothetical protein IPH12_11540 [Saprospirales bacterium]|nr:hypothetical protein [Saprospirales bacterium]